MKRLLLAASFASLAVTSCGTQKPTALVVAVSSEVNVPDDVDTLEIHVKSDGSSKFDRTYDLRVQDGATIPGTITVFDDGSDPSRPVDIAVTARLHDGESRLVRSTRVKFVEEKQKLLRMPLRFSCLDFPKTCGADETCKAGACQKNVATGDDLPDFDEKEVFAAKGDGRCFDRKACVPDGATVETTALFLKRPDCSVTLDELKAAQGDGAAKAFDKTALNVGFVWNANATGKWTAVDYDAEEGWQLVDEGGGMVKLAPGLCDAVQGRLLSKTGGYLVKKAIANPSCPPKLPTQPECPAKLPAEVPSPPRAPYTSPMGIFDRMSRLISSNVNALLDKAEDPKKSLDLLLDEMKEQIGLGRKEVQDSLATEKQLEKKIADLDAEADKWAKRAELALKADDESLARDALLQKKRVVGDRDKAEALLAEARATTLRLKNDLRRMEDKIKEVEARKGTLATQLQQAKSGGGSESLGARGGSSAFDEFRRMEGEIDRKEAEGAAAREVDDALDPGKSRGGLSRDELEAKFAALERGGAGKKGDDVDDELAALKKKVRVK